MKILFTGATGVLGRAALPVLLAEGHHITAVSRSDRDATWLGEIGAEPAEVDLFDRASVDRAMSGVDTVVHFATAIPPMADMAKRSNWETNDRLRTTATGLLVDSAVEHGVERFIQQSVAFVYADGGDEWLDETSPIKTVWDVLDSALDAEAHVDRFRAAGGTGVVLRLASLYGPAASKEYVEAVRLRSMPLIGNGQNFVSSIHSADAATALTAALAAPDGTYNVADDEPMRAAERLDALVDVLNAPRPRRIPKAMARVALKGASAMLTVSHRVSNTRFKTATGWQPGFPSARQGWAGVAPSNQPE